MTIVQLPRRVLYFAGHSHDEVSVYSEKPALHRRQKAHQPGQLRTIALDVTAKCNMACPKCYAETFVGKAPLSTADLIDALEQFYDLGVFHYVLQGGEAIMAPDRLETILRHCHADETYINVVSNGWGVTPTKVRWLKELKVDKIAFSLDSGRREEHDAGRMEGSFDWVMRAIDNVLDAGLLTSISTVVTHQSLHSEGFRMALDFARRREIRMDVQIAEPVGKWDGQREFLITPDDAAYIKELQRTMGHLPNGQTMINRDIFSGDHDHCPAGTEFMGLSADGELLPCNFLQYSLGNVRDFRIADMREALLKSPWFDGRRPNCIIGEDRDFLAQFVDPYIAEEKPLDAYAVFKIQAPAPRR